MTITDFNLDTVTTHYAIDATASTVRHDPGLVFFPIEGNGHSAPNQQSGPHPLSGQFDVDFLRYRWTYTSQDADGTVYGPFVDEQNWITFHNVDLTSNPALSGFTFPNYFVRVSGTDVGGDNGPCTLPFDPNTFCSGWTTGVLASLTGQFNNGMLVINGWSPVYNGNLFEGFSYHILANAVPEPGIMLLFASGLCSLAMVLRRRRQA